jgi:hypothetical protein
MGSQANAADMTLSKALDMINQYSDKLAQLKQDTANALKKYQAALTAYQTETTSLPGLCRLLRAWSSDHAANTSPFDAHILHDIRAFLDTMDAQMVDSHIV